MACPGRVSKEDLYLLVHWLVSVFLRERVSEDVVVATATHLSRAVEIVHALDVNDYLDWASNVKFSLLGNEDSLNSEVQGALCRIASTRAEVALVDPVWALERGLLTRAVVSVSRGQGVVDLLSYIKASLASRYDIGGLDYVQRFLMALARDFIRCSPGCLIETGWLRYMAEFGNVVSNEHIGRWWMIPLFLLLMGEYRVNVGVEAKSNGLAKEVALVVRVEPKEGQGAPWKIVLGRFSISYLG